MQRPEIVHDPAILAEPQMALSLCAGIGDQTRAVWENMHHMAREAYECGVPMTSVVFPLDTPFGMCRFKATCETASHDLRADRVLILTKDTIEIALGVLGAELPGDLEDEATSHRIMEILSAKLPELRPTSPRIHRLDDYEGPDLTRPALYADSGVFDRALDYRAAAGGSPIVTCAPFTRSGLAVDAWWHLFTELLRRGYHLVLSGVRETDSATDYGFQMHRMVDRLIESHPRNVTPIRDGRSIFHSWSASEAANFRISTLTWSSWPFTAHRRYHALLWQKYNDYPLSIPSDVRSLTCRPEFGTNLYLRTQSIKEIGGAEGRAHMDRVLRWSASVPLHYEDDEPPAIRSSGEELDDAAS